jgi:hypothetical protein
MKRQMTFFVLFLLVILSYVNLHAKLVNVLPSKEHVQQMLMSRSWYIVKGEGTGGPALAGGTFVFSTTHRDYSYEGRPLGKQKYKIISTRNTKSGDSYFFDLEIINIEFEKLSCT